MHLQYTPYMLPPLLSTLIILALGVYALRHRDVRGAIPFGVCMLLTVLWSGGYALELGGTDLPAKLFWAHVESIGYAFDAVIWLNMVFLFVERDHWVTRRNILLLLVVPALAVLLSWTNGLHGLIWRNAHLDTNGPFIMLARNFGPAFWAIAAYSYLLNAISEVLLFLSLRRKSAFFREQARALFVGLALFLPANLSYIFGIRPFHRYDFTPVAAGVAGLIIGWSVFHYRLFDIVPVARENIIESMADGLIILDNQNRIADMNPTARSIFGLSFVQDVGREATVFFQDWPALAGMCCDREKPPAEVVMVRDGCTKTFEVSCSSLRDSRAGGLSILLHDVTERKAAQARLLEQERALAMSEERERLARELHDSLAQVLGYINVQAQAVREYFVRGQADGVVNGLERLIRVAGNTQNEVREYIQNVRGIAAAEQNFVAALKNCLERYDQNYGITAELNIPEGLAMDRIEPAAGRQLLLIIQESLTNVRKHAGTDSVTITFLEKVGHVQVVVEDKGRGFELNDKRDGQRFGLNIMAERAQAAGGRLTIQTKPGQGTRLEVEIPVSAGGTRE